MQPSSRGLQYVLRGIKRSPRPPARSRLPITPATLRALKSQWAAHARDIDFVMLWAACCTGFFGFLRAGEFIVRSREDFDPSVALTSSDIAVDRHQSHVYHLLCAHVYHLLCAHVYHLLCAHVYHLLCAHV